MLAVDNELKSLNDHRETCRDETRSAEDSIGVQGENSGSEEDSCVADMADIAADAVNGGEEGSSSEEPHEISKSLHLLRTTMIKYDEEQRHLMKAALEKREVSTEAREAAKQVLLEAADGFRQLRDQGISFQKRASLLQMVTELQSVKASVEQLKELDLPLVDCKFVLDEWTDKKAEEAPEIEETTAESCLQRKALAGCPS